MGFFGNLAKKVGGAVSTLGKKVASGVRTGVKYGITHSEKIAQVAGKVGDIAGTVGNIATAGAGITAGMGLEPVAGVLGGVAGLSKAVGAGAGAVQGVANRVTQAKQQASRFGIDANQLANRYL
jgi:phage-related minor tail protein